MEKVDAGPGNRETKSKRKSLSDWISLRNNRVEQHTSSGKEDGTGRLDGNFHLLDS